MTRRSWRVPRLAGLGGVVLVASALIPAAATAAPATPFFTYIDRTTVEGALTSADTAGASPTALTAGLVTRPATSATTPSPTPVQTYSFDVSPDGNTMVVAMRLGLRIGAADRDQTYGLVLVHREGGSVLARLLATRWSGNPALSDSGKTTTFMSAGHLWQYVVESWTPAAGDWTTAGIMNDRGTAWAPTSTEVVSAIAASDSGNSVAVMYRNKSTGLSGRLVAGLLQPTPVITWSKSFGTGTVQPTASTLVFLDDAHLLVSTHDSRETAGQIDNAVAVVPASGSSSTLSAAIVTLTNYYSVRHASDGTWWMWTDTASGTPSVVSSTPATVSSSAGLDPTLWPAPDQTGQSARSDGATTYGYTPSDVIPPALSDVAGGRVANPSVAHPTFGLTPISLKTGAATHYYSYNLYETKPIGVYAMDTAAEVDRGYLQWSQDNGITWTKGVATSGSTLTSAYPYVFNGSTQRLYRSTKFRWSFDGDFLTKQAVTSARMVAVTPTITVTVTPTGSFRIVAGKVFRVGGSAELWRYGPSGWVKLRSVTIASTSTDRLGNGYSFGRLTLRPGSYKVVVPADASWSSNSRTFSIV